MSSLRPEDIDKMPPEAQMALMRTGLVEVREDFPADHPDLDMYVNHLCGMYQQRGMHAQALQVLTEQLELIEKAEGLGPESKHAAMYKGKLAVAHSTIGNHLKAKTLYREVLDLERRILPENHPDIARSMVNLATCRAQLGDHAGALEELEAVLVEQKRLLPRDHESIANTLFNMHSMQRYLDRHEDALVTLKDAYKMRRRVLPMAHPDLDITKRVLTALYADLGLEPEPESIVPDYDLRVCGNSKCLKALGEEGRMRCGGCKKVCYCSKDCQTMHWKIGHNKQCKAAQAEVGMKSDA
jgi:tetratricopeptide (TPR) repeat protein